MTVKPGSATARALDNLRTNPQGALVGSRGKTRIPQVPLGVSSGSSSYKFSLPAGLNDFGDDVRLGPSALTRIVKDFPGLSPKPVPKPKPAPTGPTVIDADPEPNPVSRQFNPYPAVLPPLSPQMMEQLEARRAMSLRRLQEAEATGDSLRQRAQLENVGRLLNIDEETARSRRSGLADLAARGVARSPMFANPFRRELARLQQQQIGQSQQQLTRTLDQLGEVLRGARLQREEELSQLAFDEVRERSNIARLLGLE